MNEVTTEEIAPLVFRPSHLSSQSNTRTAWQTNFVVSLILLSAGFERLAFYALAGNLTFFLDSNQIGWIFPHTIIAPLIFLGNQIKIL